MAQNQLESRRLSKPDSRGFARRRACVGLGAALLLVAAGGCASVKERLWLSTGNKLYNAQKYEDAVKEYEKVLAVNPNHWDANYMVAVSYLALYHPGSTHPKDLEYAEKAIAAFERCLKLEPPTPDVRDKVQSFYVGLLTDTNKMDKAVEYFRGLLQKDPDNPDLLLQLAGLCAKSGDFACALENYTKRAEVDPTNKEAWYTVGVVCWERSFRGGPMVSHAERDQIVVKGFEALDKALAIDSDYASALAYVNLLYREKAKVLVESGNPQEAGMALLKADEYQKKSAEAFKKAQGAQAAGQTGG